MTDRGEFVPRGISQHDCMHTRMTRSLRSSCSIGPSSQRLVRDLPILMVSVAFLLIIGNIHGGSSEVNGAPVGIRTRVPSSTGSDDRPLHYRGIDGALWTSGIQSTLLRQKRIAYLRVGGWHPCWLNAQMERSGQVIFSSGLAIAIEPGAAVVAGAGFGGSLNSSTGLVV